MSSIPVDVERRVRAQAHHRCGYCLGRQDLIPIPLEIDHLRPRAKGGTDEESNLWIACSTCNGHKHDKTIGVDPESGETVPLFNPRTQNWFEHFRWSEDGIYIMGLTPVGRATVSALHLSTNPIVIQVRRNWVAAGLHPPTE